MEWVDVSAVSNMLGRMLFLPIACDAARRSRQQKALVAQPDEIVHTDEFEVALSPWSADVSCVGL